MLRIVCRVKCLENCILVTDAMQAATMPPGTYRLAHTEAELLPNGKVVRSDRSSMAGSALTMNRAVRNFIHAVNCPPISALRAATINPLRAIGRAADDSGVVPGAPADLILYNPGLDRLHIRETLVGGTTVFEA